jgi:hypothetical protein
MSTALPTFDNATYRLPTPPVASSPAEERLSRKRELAASAVELRTALIIRELPLGS